jgi:hypothetical protein
LKVSDNGDTVSVCAADTTSFTRIVVVGVAEFWNVSVMPLLYVPGESVFWDTLAVTMLAVLPAVTLDCEIWSQFPPVMGVTDAVYVVLPPVAIRVICCDAGGAAPCVCANVREVGVTLTVVFAETVNTTGIMKSPLGRFALLFAWIVIVPL